MIADNPSIVVAIITSSAGIIGAFFGSKAGTKINNFRIDKLESDTKDLKKAVIPIPAICDKIGLDINHYK